MTATQVLPDRYRDAEPIARGAMGEILRATDTTLDRVVAVKLLAEPYVADESARRRFAREARAAARVSGDPNIVTIYDVGAEGERPYIVMEYIDGPSLEERLRAGRVAPADALRWLEQTGRALDHAHANGVVHRDVKPGNLLLDRAGDVHVADFGIASAAWLPSLTVSGTVLGTAGYLAPEQALGETTSPASDRYALAIVAYELLTGTRPFARETPTAEAQAHVSDPVPPIAPSSGLPHGLDDVFARALAKRPDDRYATSSDFVADLRSALQAEPTPTRAFTAATVPVPRQTRPRTNAPRWPLVVAVLGALAAAAVVAVVALSSRSSNHTTAEKQAKQTHRTTTHAATTATTSPTTPQAQAASAGPHTLNDQAWALMQQRRYSEALPLLQSAVPALQGLGPADPAEGYANYNLGYTLLQLGRCAEGQTYLEHAQALEPNREEVRQALDQTRHCLDEQAKGHEPQGHKPKGHKKPH